MIEERPTPRFLQEVLGERFVPLEAVVVAGFGASVASLALALLPASELSLPLRCVYALFTLNVAYAFAVDHDAPRRIDSVVK